MPAKMIEVAPPVSDDDLDKIETQLKFKFPKAIRRHYLRWNGGRPSPNLFQKNDEIYSVNEFLPIGYGVQGASFEDTYNDLVQGNYLFPKGIVPFANDAGGDYFCFGVEPDRNGAILFYQSDYFDDPARAVVFLSENIEVFLDELVTD